MLLKGVTVSTQCILPRRDEESRFAVRYEIRGRLGAPVWVTEQHRRYQEMEEGLERKAQEAEGG